MSSHVFNFSAGPAILPPTVIERASEALVDFNGTGIGICEHSHRGPAFTEVINAAEANIRKLVGISDDYAVLFLQGGASSQFFMIPANLLGGGTADYIDTGAWSKKAIAEAKRYGQVHVAGSGAETGYDRIPAELTYSDAPAYVHFTSNNTIAGTQWSTEPTPPDGVPLICDASSDIFSRPLAIDRYGLLYAGAQKNLGPSGVTLVIARRDLIAGATSDLPTMLQYRTHESKGSMFNTPPTFAIFVVGEVVKWLLEEGGLEAMAKRNQRKAQRLYSYLDDSDFFRATAQPGSRSLMNVCFRSPSAEQDAAFAQAATAAGLANLKGHRSVGGMRASIYNAFPASGVEALIAFMDEFAGR